MIQDPAPSIEEIVEHMAPTEEQGLRVRSILSAAAEERDEFMSEVRASRDAGMMEKLDEKLADLDEPTEETE